MDTLERRIYQVINVSTAPVWLAMILAPRARLTARAVRLAAPVQAGLGLTYLGLLAGGIRDGGGRVDFTDPESVRAALTRPRAFLAGWAHFLAFDLFVGVSIWRQGLAQGRSTRVALVLTWLFGPLGLTLFLAQRAASRDGSLDMLDPSGARS